MRLGYTTTIMPLEHEDLDLQITKKIRAGVADGYLVGGSLVGPLTRDVIIKNDMPAVCHISDRVDLLRALSGIEAVYADITPALKELVELLQKQSITEIATFGSHAISKTRNARFKKVAESAGMAVSSISYSKVAVFTTDWRTAFYAAQTLLDEIKRFKAVFCSSDLVAMGLCDALIENGVFPGKDIQVIGCDNLEGHSLRAANEPFLTTIDKNETEIGQAMAMELHKRINGCSAGNDSFGIPSKLIVRDSFNPSRRETK
jgi:DNA-binding LacI/PurR family transcriptional regulator